MAHTYCRVTIKRYSLPTWAGSDISSPLRKRDRESKRETESERKRERTRERWSKADIISPLHQYKLLRAGRHKYYI